MKRLTNPQIQILCTQQEVQATLQKLYNFLHQRKEDVQRNQCLRKLKDMQGKFSDLMDIYSISPDSFPGLLNILLKNTEVLKNNFNMLTTFVNDYGILPDNCNEFILDHCNEVNAQYIKVTIEGLYNSLIAKTLPSLSAEDVKESLTFSLINLTDFFR